MSSIRAATAIGVGYLLGRRRKLRTAALLAAATAVGGKSVGGLILQRGIKMLGSTEAFAKLAPQLGDITETVRDDLLAAGKAAATAAVINRVDSLTSSIHDRAERLRNPGDVVAAGAEEATEAAGTAGRAASSAGRRATSGAGGAARRATGRGRPDAREPDDRDQDQDQDETNDLVDRDRDEYRDRREPDDYEGEPDDYDEPEDRSGPDDDDAEPDDHDEPEDRGEADYDEAEPAGGRAGRPAGNRTGRAPAASARRGNGERRTPVSRARR
jgi:hypothetical protein